jgi:hypothetical protein
MMTTKDAVRAIDSAIWRALERTGGRLPRLTRAHDRLVLRYRMRNALGYTPNLKNPRTYNEKLGWRMLNDRNPLLPITTDKLAVRDYVAGKIGADFLVPILGAYERAADIPWDSLPNRFIVKATHGCDMNLIVRDKSVADERETRSTAASWLQRSHYAESREWAYRAIPHRIIIEELLVDEDGQLPVVFKFIVFHGRAELVRVHLGRFGDHRVNFYDRQLTFLPMRQTFPTDPTYRPPGQVSGMLKIAEKLAEDFDYARIDLYLCQGQVRFGEITHYDGSAEQPFRPPELDEELGRLWRLPVGGAGSTPGPAPALGRSDQFDHLGHRSDRDGSVDVGEQFAAAFEVLDDNRCPDSVGIDRQ